MLPLYGKLVQIQGVEGLITPAASNDNDSCNQEVAGINPNGMQGVALAFGPERPHEYLVLTFDALQLPVPADNVVEFFPEDPELGGFDLAWPALQDSDSTSLFTIQMLQCLAKKGYCMVQTFLQPKDRHAAVDMSFDVEGWTLPKKELDAAYLGRQNTTKYTLLPESPDEQEVLSKMDSLLTVLGLSVEPYVQEVLGFSAWGRLSSLLRVPMVGTEEVELRPKPPTISSSDYQDGRMFGHVNFLERRRLLMMLLIDNEGGEVVLEPFQTGTSLSPASLPIQPNRLLVVRHDVMSYSYRPRGINSLALQAWLLTAPTLPDASETKVAKLPQQIHGDRTHVMSLAGKYPGAVDSPDQLWNFFTSGTDALVRVPVSRWDMELYYSADQDEGFSYATHGGFCSDSALIYFANDMFGISDEEASNMSPAQRLVLEVGHEVLFRSGMLGPAAKVARGTGNGQECGVFLGDSGTDWPQLVGKHPDPNRMLGMSNAVTSTRLSHVLGLRGPCSSVDTACSSSLVAINLAHSAIRATSAGQSKPNFRARVSSALAIGVGLLLSPRYYILYSGPHMLSPRGRCFTFDGSADGYARGEGCGGLLVKMSSKVEEAEEMLACLIGSAVNQDGRSASMTAPNGPSQQQCIKASMQESGLGADEINIAECHGTGTALGDPIEVSALRMVMQDRKSPLLSQSAKTNIGHLEASAGMAGFLKCVCMINASTASPNNHFYSLNPHMDVSGYPVYFGNEHTDTGLNAGISGVSSFGFGGTNARGDIWGRCLRGPRATEGINSEQLLPHRNLFFSRIYNYGSPGPHHTDKVYLVGTWDAYVAAIEMERLPSKDPKFGEYFATVDIGETRKEQFRVMLNNDVNQTVHPKIHLANQSCEIQGPDNNVSNNWLIDGNEHKVPAGGQYRVKFEWNFSWEGGEHMRVKWEPEAIHTGDDNTQMPSETDEDDEELYQPYRHNYSIVASWTAWKFQEMIPSSDESGLWTTSVRIGLSGQEEFQFSRDNDWSQIIHPSCARATAALAPVKGPDNKGTGNNWLLSGRCGEIVTIQLRVVDGDITVTTASETHGVQRWRNALKGRRQTEYHISGSWNNWGLLPMISTPSGSSSPRGGSSIYRHRVEIGDAGTEEFQVVVENEIDDPAKASESDSGRVRYYPHVQRAALGQGTLCGPDSRGHGLNWLLEGQPGSVFEVMLDLGQVDRKWAVSWAIIEDELPALTFLSA